MKPIETEQLIIRDWQDGDREIFHLIDSDEEVMPFVPFRRNRMRDKWQRARRRLL